ncbi:AAA family ATPase [Mesorhizobium sp. M0904]|uniref:AAA family ATPase n=1 Tax=Mesorhizobium sp. M0904 TaxID=2957022 RepID=UPI003339CFD7
MTDFTVFPPSRGDPPSFTGVALLQDRWNDYSFMTQYHLVVSVPEFSGLIGAVKILRRSQTESDDLQLPTGPLSPLGDDFVSLGQELDYYERLAGLPETLRQEILAFLRDALAFPQHAETFATEKGWSTSILRYVDWDSFRRDAAVLLNRDYDRVARLGLEVSFHVEGWVDPLRIDFKAPGGHLFWDTSVLPERVAVLIGRNGSGKSTLLSRLARVLHASQRERASEPLKALGAISPLGIGFTRIVNVAYSAFDAFQLPGVDYRERKQIVDDLERGVGRYHYCGLRDIASEVRQAEGIGDIDGTPIQPQDLDRQERIILKTSEQLSKEFGAIVLRIKESGRQNLFNEVCRVLGSDSSFFDLGSDPAASIFEYAVPWFRVWSTGHKIVMHAVASLVAYTEPKSIVLIDEPESHLHPPLLAALMHAVRIILRQNDAFAVVATHSPVVVQETLARHIAIVRRSGAEIRIFSPRIETYGESIGEVTNEIFGLNVDATDFHSVLSQLVDTGLSLESIEGLFERGLSLQARAFVMTKLASKRT